MSKAFSIIGLTLTILGAGLLALRDLRRQDTAVMFQATPNPKGGGMIRSAVPPHPHAWHGFGLIAIGTLLQIIGTALS